MSNIVNKKSAFVMSFRADEFRNVNIPEPTNKRSDSFDVQALFKAIPRQETDRFNLPQSEPLQSVLKQPDHPKQRKRVSFSVDHMPEDRESISSIIRRINKNKIRVSHQDEATSISHLRDTLDVFDAYSYD